MSRCALGVLSAFFLFRISHLVVLIRYELGSNTDWKTKQEVEKCPITREKNRVFQITVKQYITLQKSTSFLNVVQKGQSPLTKMIFSCAMYIFKERTILKYTNCNVHTFYIILNARIVCWTQFLETGNSSWTDNSYT